MKKKYTKLFEIKPTKEEMNNTIVEAEKFLSGVYVEHYLETNSKIWLLDIRIKTLLK